MHTFGKDALTVDDVVRLSIGTETFLLSNDARLALEANMAESVAASATGSPTAESLASARIATLPPTTPMVVMACGSYDPTPLVAVLPIHTTLHEPR